MFERELGRISVSGRAAFWWIETRVGWMRCYVVSLEFLGKRKWRMGGKEAMVG